MRGIQMAIRQMRAEGRGRATDGGMVCIRDSRSIKGVRGPFMRQ